MVQTRSGEVTTASPSKAAAHKPAAKKQPKSEAKSKTAKDATEHKTPIEARDDTDQTKRKRDENDVQEKDKHASTDSPSGDTQQPPPKKPALATKPQAESSKDETILHKIRKTIDEYGSLPLDGLAVKEPLKPNPDTLLAIVINSMLRSTRISHNLAQKASVHVINAGYHDIKTLSEASWDNKVNVLSEGGYNRYRESMATRLGHLANLVNEKYDGDLNNLLEKASHKPEKVRHLVREIKGFGDVATDLFCDDAQAIWPVLAPTIDHRSLDTAAEVGLGRDIEHLFVLLERDAVQMSKLARGLSNVRLSKSQEDIKHEE